MDEKRVKLIEAGMRLFAESGYYRTSIQDIADEANISKGAFYLYFDSKETFLIDSIEYFHTKLTTKLTYIKEKELSPKDTLAEQINLLTEYIYNNRNFIIMMFREDISIGEKAKELFERLNQDNIHWLKNNIETIFQVSSHHLQDLMIHMDGLMKGYYQWIVLGNLTVDKKRFGTYLVNRLDDIYTGLRKRDEKSIIVEGSILSEDIAEHPVLQILEQMKDEVHALGDHDEQEKLLSVMDVLKENLEKEPIETYTVQGLLAHFKHIDVLKKHCENLAQTLGIELLH